MIDLHMFHIVFYFQPTYSVNTLIYFSNLESHAKQLPVSTPMTVQMERLSRFLHDGQIDSYTSELYDKALEASTWMETNNVVSFLFFTFLLFLHFFFSVLKSFCFSNYCKCMRNFCALLWVIEDDQ